MSSKLLIIPIVFFIFTFTQTSVYGYKILGLFPIASRSHFYLGSELMKGLAKVGHNVTMMTVYPDEELPNTSYHQIIMENVKEIQMDYFKPLLNLTQQDGFQQMSLLNLMAFYNILCYDISKAVLAHPYTQHLIKSGEKFDGIIIPQYCMEAIKALAPKLDAHLIIFSNNAASGWTHHLIGNPSLPSLNSETYLGYTSPMTFSQRVTNTLFSIIWYLNTIFNQYPTQNKLVHEYISKDIDLSKIVYNVSLILFNSHSSMNPPVSGVPCSVEIGGFHIKSIKKLPDDLQKYMDDAEEGIIYFSLGSNFKSVNIPLETRKALLKAFSKRKEKVVWKFEADEIPSKPKNVKIEKWLPQSDLLAHPNVKLFITHGGFLSIIEALHHGIPVLVLPIAGDQMKNGRQAEKNGYAKVIDFADVDEESISEAIEEMIENKKYSENAKKRSKIFHDRPLNPLDEAIYWIQYVLRHNGAEHLRVDYLNLAWFQYYLFDVAIFLLAIVLMLFCIVKKILYFILQKILWSKKVKKS